MCAGCPHLFDCREYGLALPAAVVGVFGGLSTRERTLERRARRQQSVLAAQPAGCEHDGIDDDQADVSTESHGSVAAGNGATDRRTCAVCGAVLAANRQRTCSASSAAEHKRRTNAGRRNGTAAATDASRREASANGNGRPAAVTTGPVVTGRPETVAVLEAAGFRLTGYLLEHDGQPWTLTRSEP